MDAGATAIVHAPLDVKAEVAKAGHDAASHNQQDRRCDRLRRSVLCLPSLRSMCAVSVRAVLLPHSSTLLQLLWLARWLPGRINEEV